MGTGDEAACPATDQRGFPRPQGFPCDIGALETVFIVNSTDDVDEGTCDAIHCSLREAINTTNASSGTDLIAFNIPGAGPHTIQPTSALPTITDPVIIDGYTQPGATMATATTSATLQIELDGTNAGARANGFSITAGNSTIRGLVVNRFGQHGIQIENSGSNQIEGNYIGTDVTGTLDLGNSLDGVDIALGAQSNTIGGSTAGERNIISGNVQSGVRIADPGTDKNIVSGNYLGTDVTGTLALGNTVIAVFISQGAQFNTVGGDTPGKRNIISGNDHGVFIRDSDTDHNVVSGR